MKDLAEELAIEYECFGSTTWRRQERMGGAVFPTVGETTDSVLAQLLSIK